MKMTKKLLLTAAVMFVASFGFMACSDDEDDPADAISGWNNNYTLSYDNSLGYGSEDDAKDGNLSGTYRAWSDTTLKHLGSLTKITISGQKTDSLDGVMGLVWDLKAAESDNSTGNDFLVVGLRNNKGTLQYYVSKYYNITNKLATNFGADATTTADSISDADATKIAAGTAFEHDISKGFQSLGTATIEDGDIVVWVDVYPAFATSSASSDKRLDYGVKDTSSFTKANDAGKFIVDFYTTDPTEKDSTATVAASVTISATGYDAITKADHQNKLAVYANIYSGSSLSGKWNYADTYAEAEKIEDAE